jgi:hypothetical protein
MKPKQKENKRDVSLFICAPMEGMGEMGKGEKMV